MSRHSSLLPLRLPVGNQLSIVKSAGADLPSSALFVSTAAIGKLPKGKWAEGPCDTLTSMADHRDLAKLLEGRRAWKVWKQRRRRVPDLRSRQLAGLSLTGFDFDSVNLRLTNFSGADSTDSGFTCARTSTAQNSLTLVCIT
jgi:hypothetical protein